jgi:hypothetical protein
VNFSTSFFSFGLRMEHNHAISNVKPAKRNRHVIWLYWINYAGIVILEQEHHSRAWYLPNKTPFRTWQLWSVVTGCSIHALPNSLAQKHCKLKLRHQIHRYANATGGGQMPKCSSSYVVKPHARSGASPVRAVTSLRHGALPPWRRSISLQVRYNDRPGRHTGQSCCIRQELLANVSFSYGLCYMTAAGQRQEGRSSICRRRILALFVIRTWNNHTPAGRLLLK